MADLWLIRDGMNLRPFGAESAAVLSKIQFGKVLRAEVKQPRNGAHHRLYWTLCARIAAAVGCDAEHISHILKVRTGHVDIVKTKRGVEEIPCSISFAKMDQTAFNDFFEKCVNVIYTELGIARSDIIDCVKDLLEEKAA